MTFDPKLGRAFKFDEQELELNRIGKLSEAQRKFLRKGYRFTLIAMGVLAVLMFGLAVGVAFGDVLSDTLRSSERRTQAAIFFAVLGLACVLVAWWQGRKQFGDARAGLAAMIEGKITIVNAVWLTGVYGGSQRPYLKVQDQTFLLVGGVSTLRKQEGTPYRVYYAPRTKQIVSMERVVSDGEV